MLCMLEKGVAMVKDPIEDYKKYIASLGDRNGIYKMIAQTYKITSAIYPGSHIDITPSLYIPKVTYIDNNKSAPRFFKKKEAILSYLNQYKNYPQSCQLTFIEQDYSIPLDIEPVDLIICRFCRTNN